MLRFALLGLLSRAPMTGYDLERWIRRSIDHFWSAQLSQIYRTLRQLENDGLVTSSLEHQASRPDRRVYALTPAGEKALAAWLTELVTERDPVRVPFLVRFFFYGTRDVGEVLIQLRVLREIYAREAERFDTDIPRAVMEASGQLDLAPLDPLYWGAVHRAGVLYVRYWLAWLDETIESLESARPGAT